MIIGLLAARNAGIEVPDESIDKAIAYFRSMTARSGDVFYLNLGNTLSTSTARVSIATLAYAVARRKDLAEYKATLNYLKQRIGEPSGPFGEYTLYYEAQALFQGDFDSWGEVERDPRPPSQEGATARRQHPGPIQPGDLHVAVAALASGELSLPSHLRTVIGCPQEWQPQAGTMW